MVAILIMSAKFAALDLLKIKISWKIIYDVIVYIHDINNKILSRDSRYCIPDVVVWPKFGNSSISMREVIITSTLYQKIHFLRGATLGPSSINWDRKFLGLFPTLIEVTGQKLIGDFLITHPSWIGLKSVFPSYRQHLLDFQCKSSDWFLFDTDIDPKFGISITVSIKNLIIYRSFT